MPLDKGPSRPQGRQPQESQGSETACLPACGSVWTPAPRGLCMAKEAGEGSPVSPGMICHYLMRLMSPGGWYAGVLRRSLEADAHGNERKWGPGGGVRLAPRQVASINLWAGPRVRLLGSVPPPLPVPNNTGQECRREAAWTLAPLKPRRGG